MEDLVKTILKDVPSLAAIVIVVVAFLKYIAKRDAEMQNVIQEQEEARKHSREVITENTKITAQVNQTMRDFIEVVHKQLLARISK